MSGISSGWGSDKGFQAPSCVSKFPRFRSGQQPKLRDYQLLNSVIRSSPVVGFGRGNTPCPRSQDASLPREGIRRKRARRQRRRVSAGAARPAISCLCGPARGATGGGSDPSAEGDCAESQENEGCRLGGGDGDDRGRVGPAATGGGEGGGAQIGDDGPEPASAASAGGSPLEGVVLGGPEDRDNHFRCIDVYGGLLGAGIGDVAKPIGELITGLRLRDQRDQGVGGELVRPRARRDSAGPGGALLDAQIVGRGRTVSACGQPEGQHRRHQQRPPMHHPSTGHCPTTPYVAIDPSGARRTWTVSMKTIAVRQSVVRQRYDESICLLARR